MGRIQTLSGAQVGHPWPRLTVLSVEKKQTIIAKSYIFFFNILLDWLCQASIDKSVAK